jgi:hypothetical protein
MRTIRWILASVLTLMAGAYPAAASASPVLPSGRVCFSVAGAAGDAAIVNLTPVLASAAGDGQLLSSDVSSPPVASNVNYGPGTVDPNVAIARIGADGQVCYVNAAVASVDLVADHLGTIAAASYTPATASGAPARKIDTRPPPSPTIRTFDPGQYLVGSQLPPARYEMNGSQGCYWERQSGLSGSLDDIIANDFRGFDGRVIVDIAASDVGFELDGDCGPMSTYAGSSAYASVITPGSHVVGQHILAGTYVSTVRSGCYWERLTSFGGDFDSIIANDFVSTAGQQFVTILDSDVGFFSDADCGNWQRT